MKKVLFTLILFSSISLFGQVQKIGFVDSQVILSQYAPAIKAQSDLDALAAKWTASRDSMVQALQADYGNYEQQKAMMTPDKQRESEQTLVRNQQLIQAFEQQKFAQPNGELFLKNEEMLKPIKEKVILTIEEIAKEEGMKFMFDKTGDVLLLYADVEYDMTFKVLDRLRKK